MEVSWFDDMILDMATRDALNSPTDRLGEPVTVARGEHHPDAMNIAVASTMLAQAPDSQNPLWAEHFEPRQGRPQDDDFPFWNISWENTDRPNEALRNPRNGKTTYESCGRTSCGICMEMTATDNLLTIGCGCRYCKPCFNGYFETGLANRASFPPRCCGQEISLPSVRQYLVSRVVERYEDVQEEFRAKNPTYCAGCSTFLPGAVVSGDFKACPKCLQQTCIRCKNARSLHVICGDVEGTSLATTSRSRGGQCPGVDVPPELTVLIKTEEWNRCPTCQHVVEKIDGCNFMECVCGSAFCYGCGFQYLIGDERCECMDSLSDGEEEEDGGDGEEDAEEDENGEWPRYAAAVDARGRIRCMHELTSMLNEENESGDTSGRCHGCLREMPEMRSCDMCQLELCTECLR